MTAAQTNKREFSRVDARLPLEIRLVPMEERQNVRARRESEKIKSGIMPPDVEDPLLAEWLKHLLDKMDKIIDLLSLHQADRKLPPLRTENLSGGGVSFTSAQEFHPGDLIEIKMIFTETMEGALYLYGEVVQSEARDDGFFTAVCFVCLDDSIRDDIIRFVFEKEREILRERRR